MEHAAGTMPVPFQDSPPQDHETDEATFVNRFGCREVLAGFTETITFPLKGAVEH
jgi:hypothetical protein